jgi:hypothetical protein
MYATVIKVKELTDVNVDDSLIRQAQAIVEVVSGRPESVVTKLTDRAWMEYAVCWQAAYMSSNTQVFTQANVKKVEQDRSMVEFGDQLFAVSPLVIHAVKQLSWNRSRSFSTKGFTFKAKRMPSWWRW